MYVNETKGIEQVNEVALKVGDVTVTVAISDSDQDKYAQALYAAHLAGNPVTVALSDESGAYLGVTGTVYDSEA